MAHPGAAIAAPHSASPGKDRGPRRRPRSRAGLLLAALLLCVLPNGCAALTNPAAEGVPVRLVPPELLAHPKDPEVTIPLNLLGQPPALTYRLAPGDFLGVYIDGVLGERNQPIP